MSAGCQRKATGPPPRYMVVRFENLSADPSLDWVCRASSEFLSHSLAGALDGPVVGSGALGRLSGTLGPRPISAPGISTERSAALVAGATRIISGYVERVAGRLRIAATEEDTASGKSIRLLTAVDSTPIGALTRLAREFSPTAGPYLTSSPEALRLYFTGVESSRGDAARLVEQAIQADPNFGPAWLLLTNLSIAAGNRTGAEELIGRSRRQSLDRLDTAELDLDDAGLRGDRNGRIEALRRIVALSPGDTLLLRSVAETETTAGQFEAAAADWNKLTGVLQKDADAWNQLGYTRAWAGDSSGALAAMKQYASLRPRDPNPLDSTGDVLYMYGKFSEAAANYLQANARNPAFQKGGDLYKAAWAMFKAGDKAGADKTFGQFQAARTSPGNNDIALFRADWLYRTGRRKEAIVFLRKDALSPNAAAQLVIWDLLAGDRAAAAKDSASVGPAATPLIFAARFAALPGASAAEWEARADRMIKGPGTDGFREIALGYALLLDGKKEAALPVWRKITETTAGTDFFSRAVYARLRGEPLKTGLTPDSASVNPFSALLDVL